MNLPQNLDHLKFNSDSNSWDAACCVVIVEESLFFILRSQTMPTHPGQIGFIGGSKKPGETPVETGLREFEEESSFEFNGQFIGYLDAVTTREGGSILVPICFKSSLTKVEFTQKLQSNGEWDQSFYIPIEKLAESSRWSIGHFHLPLMQQSKQRVYFFPIHEFVQDCETILWGASAAIVVDFLRKTQAL